MDSQTNPIEPQTKEDGKNMVLAAISYLGPLVIISLLIGKHDPFVKFHVKQGLVVFSIEIIGWIICFIPFPGMWLLYMIIKLATLILSIIGIINVSKKHEKELPIVGHLSKHFNI